MKKTVVVYKDEDYSINECEFFKDCILFDEDMIIPITEYKIIEKEIPINSLTLDEFRQIEKNNEKLHWIIIDEAYKIYPDPITPYENKISNDNFSDFLSKIRDSINNNTKIPSLKRYNFFDFDLYKSYLDEFEKRVKIRNEYIEQKYKEFGLK